MKENPSPQKKEKALKSAMDSPVKDKYMLGQEFKQEKEDENKKIAAESMKFMLEQMVKDKNFFSRFTSEQLGKLNATKENADKIWEEAIEPINKMLEELGLDLLIKPSEKRKHGHVKSYELFIRKKDSGVTDSVEIIYLDTSRLTTLKTPLALRTEIMNHLLTFIADKALVNLFDDEIRARIQQHINKMQITRLWKRTQEKINNPPLKGEKTEKKAEKPTKKTKESTAQRRFNNLLIQAKNNVPSAVQKLKKLCLKEYEDKIHLVKGFEYVASAFYRTRTKLEYLFPEAKSLWVKKANGTEYIEVKKDNDGNFFTKQKTLKKIYTPSKGDKILLVSPIPSQAIAEDLFKKNPLSIEHTKRLLLAFGYKNVSTHYNDKIEEPTLKVTGFHPLIGPLNFTFIVEKAEGESKLKENLQKILYTYQKLSTRIESFNRYLGPFRLFKEIDFTDPEKPKVCLATNIKREKLFFTFEMTLHPNFSLNLVEIKKRDESTYSINDEEAQKKFLKLRNKSSYLKFLEEQGVISPPST